MIVYVVTWWGGDNKYGAEDEQMFLNKADAIKYAEDFTNRNSVVESTDIENRVLHTQPIQAREIH